MISQNEFPLRRGHVVGVLAANAILWVGVLVAFGDWRLGGPAVIALISIASLLHVRSRVS